MSFPGNASEDTLRLILAALGGEPITPGDADANAPGTITVARLQGWDPDAEIFRRAIVDSVGQLIVRAAIVDANTGNAFEASNPLEVRARRLETFATPTLIDISAADQVIPAGSTGLYVAVAGNIKLDCSGSTGITLPAAVGLFPLAGVTKIYKVGTTATVSFAGFPPA
jgi:hypothetical protein